MKNNIPKLYLAAFFAGLMFFYGIERLFLFSLGSTESSVSFIPVLVASVIIVFDVPLGYVADKIGRKPTLLFAVANLALAGFIYSISNSALDFAIGAIFFGFFLVGVSGAFQAILYDTLHSIGRAKEFNKIYGRMIASLIAGNAVAVFSSGFIAEVFGFRLNFQLSVACALIAFLIGLTLKEPKYHNPDKNLGWANHIKNSLKIINYNFVLKTSAIIIPVIGFIAWMSNDYTQFIFNEFGVPLYLVGVLSAVSLLAAGIGRLLAHRLTNYFGTMLILTLLFFGLVGFAPMYISIASLILFYGINSALFNNAETLVQNNLPSHLRATATSTFSLLGSILVVILGTAISIGLQYVSIFIIFRYLTVFLIAVTLIWMYVARKNNPLLRGDLDSITG